MKILYAEFIAGAEKFEQLPITNLPEIAIAGRSNVGKSSLINMLVSRKKLAYVSTTPGKTQQINLYNVDSKFCLVDLPGYGYASVSKTKRILFSKIIQEYLSKRENLKLVISLVDSRHEPMEIDLGFIETLELLHRDYIIVLTKCDKISNTLINERIEQYKYLTSQCLHCKEILPSSARNGIGKDALLGIIRKIIT